MIRLKRVYEAPAPEDGWRVLVERLWPRGFTKDRARVDRWLKEVAPSPELRTWFGHDPGNWEEFRRRYLAELEGDEQQAAIEAIRQREARGTVTFLYSAHDTEHNSAVVLKEYLQDHPAEQPPRRGS